MEVSSKATAKCRRKVLKSFNTLSLLLYTTLGRLKCRFYGISYHKVTCEGPIAFRCIEQSKVELKKVHFVGNCRIESSGQGKIKIGTDVKCENNSWLLVGPNGNLTIGDNVFIGSYVLLGAFDSIEIGNDTLIAHKAFIIDSDHGTQKGELIRNQPGKYSPVRIGSDVWIGEGVKILKGVTVGDGAIIGAGSVVTKDIPPYCFAVGVPARVLKRRD